MDNSTERKFVCIHGHFYQPPRENPWLGAIEREDSAAPYHDWNQRINLECYRANTAARLVDQENRILNLKNNYGYFSFNFGPTLLHWLEQHDPWVYRKIIEADKRSLKTHGGHGNAIAQVYNHVIMPLANQRDKLTQVLWGMRDFELRFGRLPEGMWLAETAVDRKTLSVLADAGIKYTILSPHQAARWRFIEKDAPWHEVQNGAIPSGRAYRYDCGGGKYIHLFFYDPALAQGIAFGRLLEHSSKLLAQLDSSQSLENHPLDEPWLVNVATDGESYGHHFKFGDMALAAAFQELENNPTVDTVNYGWFLSSFPVTAEIEILENSAWSCAHGLGRWSDDCGCHIGGDPGWSQKWRAPLRKALEYVRDALALHYEKQMGKICRDPWGARNDYIDVMVDRKKNLPSFLKRHLIAGPKSPTVPQFLELLEMQRFCLLMFTSCGWFFDEVSQLESVLLLKYAARAMQLAEKTGSPPVEPGFLKILKKAPSNIATYGNGANVYLRLVKPETVTMGRVAANYAIQSLTRSAQRVFQIYDYGISPKRETDLGANPVRCLYGHISVRDDRTMSEEEFLYAVIHFGGLDFRCSVKPYVGGNEYESILTALQGSVEEQNTNKMIRLLDEKFGSEYFGLKDVFKDLRASIARDIGSKVFAGYTDLQRNLFETHRPLIVSLKQMGINPPGEFRFPIRRILSEEVEKLVDDLLLHEEENLSSLADWNATDFFFRVHMARLKSLQEEAKSWNVSLRLEGITLKLGKVLLRSLTRLALTFDPQEAGRFYRLLTICSALAIWPETWKLQTLYFDFITMSMENPELLAKINSVADLVRELDNLLGCTFVRLLASVPAPHCLRGQFRLRSGGP
ncbi:MAG: DUF3536 domain-containing protein [Syntrophobacteraceae bacterium]